MIEFKIDLEDKIKKLKLEDIKDDMFIGFKIPPFGKRIIVGKHSGGYTVCDKDLFISSKDCFYSTRDLVLWFYKEYKTVVFYLFDSVKEMLFWLVEKER